MITRIFQLQPALEKVDDNMEILLELAESYVDKQQKYVVAIEQGLSRDDLTGVEDAAHVLKGSLGYFGCEMLAREVAVLEQLADAGKFCHRHAPIDEVVRTALACFDQHFATWERREPAPDLATPASEQGRVSARA